MIFSPVTKIEILSFDVEFDHIEWSRELNGSREENGETVIQYPACVEHIGI